MFQPFSRLSFLLKFRAKWAEGFDNQTFQPGSAAGAGPGPTKPPTGMSKPGVVASVPASERVARQAERVAQCAEGVSPAAEGFEGFENQILQPVSH